RLAVEAGCHVGIVPEVGEDALGLDVLLVAVGAEPFVALLAIPGAQRIGIESAVGSGDGARRLHDRWGPVRGVAAAILLQSGSGFPSRPVCADRAHAIACRPMRPILDGIRVLDVGSFVFGPAAATVMADFGADVVKVEPPERGDPYRYLHQMPPLPKCDEDYCWLLTGRGKRSVALDLKDAEGREILLRLVRQADVFVTNYPLRVLATLRLGWRDLEPLNARLVYAHATGFGEQGPEAEKPGYDATAWWARSGLQDAVPPRGGLPAISVPGMGDHPSAMALFGAIMLALYQRERTGRGSKVASSLLANGAWSNAILLQAMLCGAEAFRQVDCRAPDNALVNSYE